MILIEKIDIKGFDVLFYEGIDFEYAKSIKNDENIFVIFFVDNYIQYVKQWHRQKRIGSLLEEDVDVGILNDKSEYRIPDLESNNISVYQTSGNTKLVFETVKDKLLSGSSWSPPWGSVKSIV
jgi:hypothetical protein